MRGCVRNSKGFFDDLLVSLESKRFGSPNAVLSDGGVESALADAEAKPVAVK